MVWEVVAEKLALDFENSTDEITTFLAIVKLKSEIPAEYQIDSRNRTKNQSIQLNELFNVIHRAIGIWKLSYGVTAASSFLSIDL